MYFRNSPFFCRRLRWSPRSSESISQKMSAYQIMTTSLNILPNVEFRQGTLAIGIPSKFVKNAMIRSIKRYRTETFSQSHHSSIINYARILPNVEHRLGTWGQQYQFQRYRMRNVSQSDCSRRVTMYRFCLTSNSGLEKNYPQHV